jgi:hypothetical protein
MMFPGDPSETTSYQKKLGKSVHRITASPRYKDRSTRARVCILDGFWERVKSSSKMSLCTATKKYTAATDSYFKSRINLRFLEQDSMHPHGLRRNTLGSSTAKLLHEQGHKEEEVHIVYIVKQNLSARFNPRNSIIGKLLYVHRQLEEKKNRLLAGLRGYSEEKIYFDYFVFSIVDCSVNCGLIRSGAHCHALAQSIGNARGLDINSPLSVENHPQDLRFRRHQQHGDPNSARGSITASPPIVIVILRQQLDYVIVDYNRADHAAPDKS